MLTKPENGTEVLMENFNEEVESVKKDQEYKNWSEKHIRRNQLANREKQVRNLKDTGVETNQSEQQ